MRVQLVHKVEDAHEDSVWTVSWTTCNNATFLVTGSVDETVKVWKESQAEDEHQLEHVHTLSGVSLGAVSVGLGGVYGAVNSLDSKINVWRMDDFSPVGDVIKMGPSECWDIAFVPPVGDEKLVLALAGGSSNCIRLWDVKENKEIMALAMPEGDEKKRRGAFTLGVAVSPDGTKVAGSGMDGSIAVFDISTKEMIFSSNFHFKPVRKIAFTQDSKYVVSACDDMQVGLFDVNGGGTPLHSFSGHESWVLSVAVHPDGNAIATGGSDGKVKLWDLKEKKCVQTSSEHSDQVWGVAWSSDGKRLASVSDDRSLCTYAFL